VARCAVSPQPNTVLYHCAELSVHVPTCLQDVEQLQESDIKQHGLTHLSSADIQQILSSSRSSAGAAASSNTAVSPAQHQDAAAGAGSTECSLAGTNSCDDLAARLAGSSIHGAADTVVPQHKGSCCPDADTNATQAAAGSCQADEQQSRHQEEDRQQQLVNHNQQQQGQHELSEGQQLLDPRQQQGEMPWCVVTVDCGAGDSEEDAGMQLVSRRKDSSTCGLFHECYLTCYATAANCQWLCRARRGLQAVGSIVWGF